MTAAALTAAAWAVIGALAITIVRRDVRARRRGHEAWLAERARRDALGLEWIELHSEAGVQVVDLDGDRAITRAVVLRRWHREERLALRAGVPAIGSAVPREALNGIGDVCVLARWPAKSEGYRADAGPVVLEPDPEHGYRFGRERDPRPPRDARRYAGFFVLAAAAIALAFVPYLGAVVALLSIAYLLAELAILVRTRILGAITTGLLALFAEASDRRAEEREAHRRERDAEWD